MTQLPTVEHPKSLMGRVLVLNPPTGISEVTARWRVRGYGSGTITLESLITKQRAKNEWVDIREAIASRRLLIED